MSDLENHRARPGAARCQCHVCGRPTVSEIEGFGELRRITSDARPWRRGGRLFHCASCGTVQKGCDPAWADEAAEVYRGYTLYYQGQGTEQLYFDTASGRTMPRSRRIAAWLAVRAVLPAAGRMLDIGCGQGAMLRGFHQVLPGWRLVGHDQDRRYRAAVENLEGIEAFHDGRLAELPGAFDVVTMMYALEHILNPQPLLETILGLLCPGAFFQAQVPDLLQNPFDLLIVDHCLHFTEESAAGMLRSAGFESVAVGIDCIPKELAILGRKPAATGKRQPAPVHPAPRSDLETTSRNLLWLHGVAAAAREASRQTPFGLFGTAIAATWLSGELDGQVSFFVDEDPARAGTRHCGLPVLCPNEVPEGATIFMGLAPRVSVSAAARLHLAFPRVAWLPVPDNPAA